MYVYSQGLTPMTLYLSPRHFHFPETPFTVAVALVLPSTHVMLRNSGPLSLRICLFWPLHENANRQHMTLCLPSFV